ncbi:hypothetical protein KGY79_13930, partial [Candidatus Bipolaricaulota bacterium]|nr:hypothetical protein [Candidatus Bipolaricaulota bacterium]
KSAFKNPKGLRHEKLTQVNTLESGQMSEGTAKKVYSYMPGIRQEHELVPELKKQPLAVSVLQTLEALAEVGEGGFYLTSQELANKSGLSKAMIDKRINPVLTKLGVRSKNRGLNHYTLKQRDTEATLFRYDLSTLFNLGYEKGQILWYLFYRCPWIFEKWRDLVNGLNGRKVPSESSNKVPESPNRGGSDSSGTHVRGPP